VLENFTAAERAEVPSICEQAADATELLVALGLKPGQTRFTPGSYRLRFCVTVASGPWLACNDNWQTSQHHHCRADGAQQHSGESAAPMTADHHELRPLGLVD